MYRVTKRIEVAGAHHLDLNYPSKCAAIHGHNWIITVTCECDKLDDNGMVIDFTKIKEAVERLDHDDINVVLCGVNPTAENIAEWICHRVGPLCKKVEVQESAGNTAEFTR